MVLQGRPVENNGAHCKELNMNKVGIGVCAVGDFDISAVPKEQWALLLEAVRSLMKVHAIPKQNVIGHREAQETAGLPERDRKTCPGRRFSMTAFREAL